MAMTAHRRAPQPTSAPLAEAQLSLFGGFPVRLEIFEGPLDLLLHLVRREEVEIAEVSLAAITGQYLAYLRTMEELNIQVAADFVVLAATLLLIKSRSLLPVNPSGDSEEETDLAPDPEAELHRRLQEYRVYREAAELLEESRRERQRIFLRGTEGGEIGTGFVNLEEVSVFDMIAAVQEMLARARSEPPARMRRPLLNVADRIDEILMQLAAEKRAVHFTELVLMPATRLFVIVTFLAILELIRRQRVRVRQTTPLRDFAVELVATTTP